MNFVGLKSFVNGLIFIGVGAFFFIDSYKSSASISSEMSFALLGGIALLIYGSALLLNGFVINAISTSKA